MRERESEKEKLKRQEEAQGGRDVPVECAGFLPG